MFSRLIFGVVVQTAGLAMCFYSEKIWTVALWVVMLVLSYVLVILGAYRKGPKPHPLYPEPKE